MFAPEKPTKPTELAAHDDAALAASAANAVEQWRTYQNTYALYQQQQAAYEQYIEKQSTLTSLEEQQQAYNQYLEAHTNYQKQLEMYEQQKSYNEYYSGAPTVGASVAAAPAPFYPASGGNVPMPFQPNQPMPVPPAFSTPLAAVDPYYAQMNEHRRDPSTLKHRSSDSSRRSKAYTTTNFYANPEDEFLLPAELKQQFKELECCLCVCKMNSHISSNIHYQSKVHEKKVVLWLKDWCKQTGTPMPHRARRQQEPVEPVGPNSMRCDACDLTLTSIQHANQHYTGKRHRMVVSGKKAPTGSGFVNREGRWVRTKTDENPGRFGIGTTFVQKERYNVHDAKRMRLEPPPEPPMSVKEVLTDASQAVATSSSATVLSAIQPQLFVPPSKAPAVLPSTPATVTTPVTPTFAYPEVVQNTVEAEVLKKESADCVDSSGVFCKVCQISVTSVAVMETHLKGIKHLKKLKSVGRMLPPDGSSISAIGGDSILSSLNKPVQQNDWSLYRMPSGKYYCKSCNTIVADEKLFAQHWYGKKHKLKVKQESDDSMKSTGAPKAKKPRIFNKRSSFRGRSMPISQY
ncbi:uncharacterized protein LOC129747419 [Uranotaenia lowii]|uniref:uncharacterized protein LOC129747419 n=1 Tax=Uranotaenia lowii TaxID=190385 RepID=UPI00247A217E|nr:uncharacterized protein LOC129747419 [Uranotaenia lowii]